MATRNSKTASCKSGTHCHVYKTLCADGHAYWNFVINVLLYAEYVLVVYFITWGHMEHLMKHCLFV